LSTSANWRPAGGVLNDRVRALMCPPCRRRPCRTTATTDRSHRPVPIGPSRRALRPRGRASGHPDTGAAQGDPSPPAQSRLDELGPGPGAADRRAGVPAALVRTLSRRPQLARTRRRPSPTTSRRCAGMGLVSAARGHRRGAAARAVLGLLGCCMAGCVAACGSATPATRQLSEPDNGHTLRVRTGTTLRVVLHSTYWTFARNSAPSVVRVSGAPTYSPRPGGIPGSGNGSVSETLRAAVPGRATVSASRRSCGEALRCSPGQGSYSVVIVVTPG